MAQNLETLKVKNLTELRSSASLYLGQNRPNLCFAVLKFDSTGEFKITYNIRQTDSGKDTVCDCPAYVDNCRHKRMLRQMIRFGGLDNPQKIIVTDGKSMAWLKLESGEPLIDPSLITNPEDV